MSIWTTGDAYEMYVGRWSRPVAREFVAGLGVPAGARWLDVGCGTGALARTVLDMANPGSVVGVDQSEGFLAHARQQTPDERVRFEVGDAQALPFPNAEFDAVVSGLMLNFVPRPEAGASEMARVARPGGVVAVYLWDYAGEMQFMRHFWDAAIALSPAALELDEGRRFPICRPDALARLFTDAGIADVQVRPIDVPTTFRDFEDYWSPFLGGQGPAPAYVSSLDEGARSALRERLRATLPTAADGSISLMARAWAARGRASRTS
jgi:SAM-dependent methyltransferase